MLHLHGCTVHGVLAELLVDHLLTRPSARIQRLRGARTSSQSCHHKPGRARYARATLSFSTRGRPGRPVRGVLELAFSTGSYLLEETGCRVGPALSEPARARPIKKVRLLVSHFVRFAILSLHKMR